tara:strand:+ start:98 stop:598 length:501 start_codon:yes stop_codon:yes gene_type:complete
MNIFKKIKQERPWSSTSKYFVPFHWTLFAILWIGFLSMDAKADHNEDNYEKQKALIDMANDNKTYHGHTIESTPEMLWTSNIIGAEKLGRNTIRVKFNDGRSYDTIMVNCLGLELAHGYIFGKNWQMNAMFDQLMPGLPVYLLINNRVENNGCVVSTVLPVVIVDE